MIGIGTRLSIADNSGARQVEIIKVLRSKKQSASIGNIIVVAVKRAHAHKKVKRHDVRTAVIIHTRKYLRRDNGLRYSFRTNSAVILGRGTNPIGTRIKGPVMRELRKGNFIKIMSIASTII
jgi:large subunit ribosomal protein L14